MADVEHKTLGAGEIHLPFQWVFPTATEKNALTVGEVGKLAWQQDTNAVFICTAANPIAWVAIGGGAITPSELSGVDMSQADFTQVNWPNQASALTPPVSLPFGNPATIPVRGQAFGGAIPAVKYYSCGLVFQAGAGNQDRLMFGMRNSAGNFSIFEVNPSALTEVATG